MPVLQVNLSKLQVLAHRPKRKNQSTYLRQLCTSVSHKLQGLQTGSPKTRTRWSKKTKKKSLRHTESLSSLDTRPWSLSSSSQTSSSRPASFRTSTPISPDRSQSCLNFWIKSWLNPSCHNRRTHLDFSTSPGWIWQSNWAILHRRKSSMWTSNWYSIRCTCSSYRTQTALSNRWTPATTGLSVSTHSAGRSTWSSHQTTPM